MEEEKGRGRTERIKVTCREGRGGRAGERQRGPVSENKRRVVEMRGREERRVDREKEREIK